MNRSIGWMAGVLLIVAALAVGMLCVTSDTLAQKKAKTLAQKIQGPWVLVSIYTEQDGKKIDVFGPNPRGSLIYTPEGHFYAILMQGSLPKFISNNRVKGTAEEYQSVVQGSIAYFGRYTVDEKEQSVSQFIVGSTFPNWDGQNIKRLYKIVGDELWVTNPTTSVGGTSYIVWKRAK